ncbi:porin [Pseudochrobactrum sp. AO18b]|uniref:porin n=1 Tax=Pseudochrobactrum sp. AO18b TaxID=1201036 RepID=UPI00039F2625|nr:porin [Pseudochrobactrum sp. AO18b]
MTIKSLLLGSAAAFIAATGAQAADAVIAPEPEAVEYMRVCDAYGAGYFYIPGTETCLRIGGYVRYDASFGDDPYTGSKLGYVDANGDHQDTWDKLARFTLRTYTTSETELGTLKTFTENRFNFSNGSQGAHTLNYAYMQLGSLRMGLDESAFHTFTGYLGDIINDDVVAAGYYRTNLISYTFAGGNGFSAIISLEQGGDKGQDNYYDDASGVWLQRDFNNRIDSYMPHVVGGLKFEQGWGAIAGTVAYDSNLEEWAGKVRLDVNVTDTFSLWVQGGYASYEENTGMYGNWGGDWAVWGGAQYKATDNATFNIQAAYEDWGKTAFAANVAYQLVPGFTITPEFNYTTWKKDHPVRILSGEKDAVGGVVRFQRSF